MRAQTSHIPVPALAAAIWPERTSPALRAVILVLLGTALLTASAKVQVPFWPVPMTLTTFAVMLIAGAYGSWLGVATVVAYIAEGLAGLPVFAGPAAGPAYLVGPTAGFIWGYVPAALIIGLAADRGAGRIPAAMALAMLVGDAVLFGLGFTWLAWFAQFPDGSVGRGVAVAFAAGVQPFILGDLVKIALATALISAGWSLLKDRRRNQGPAP